MIDNWIIGLTPVIVAAIVQPLFELLQKLITVLGKLPVWAKQVAVALLSVGIVKGAAFFGVFFNIVDPSQLTQDNLAALAAAIIAYIFHNGAKNKVVTP